MPTGPSEFYDPVQDQDNYTPSSKDTKDRAKLDEYFEQQRLSRLLGKEVNKGSGNTFTVTTKFEKKKKGPTSWAAIAEQMETSPRSQRKKNEHKEIKSDKKHKKRKRESGLLPVDSDSSPSSSDSESEEKKAAKREKKRRKKEKKKQKKQKKKDKKRAKNKKLRKTKGRDSSGDSDNSSNHDNKAPPAVARRPELPPGMPVMTDAQKAKMIADEKARVAEEQAAERWQGQAKSMLTDERQDDSKWPKYRASCPLKFVARQREVAWEYFDKSGKLKRASRIGTRSKGSGSEW